MGISCYISTQSGSIEDPIKLETDEVKEEDGINLSDDDLKKGTIIILTRSLKFQKINSPNMKISKLFFRSK